MGSLREQIQERQVEYFAKFGCLDWHWYDEGLVWAIQDYLSCKGEFLEEDRAVLKEYDFIPEDFEDEYEDYDECTPCSCYSIDTCPLGYDDCEECRKYLHPYF